MVNFISAAIFIMLQELPVSTKHLYLRHVHNIRIFFIRKLGKNEYGIPQFFLESKIIAPVLPRILKH
jgi:hypothetical protein